MNDATDTNPPSAKHQSSSARTWRPLRLLNLLRGVIAVVLALYLHPTADSTLRYLEHTSLFTAAVTTLLICTALAFITIELRRPGFRGQVYALAIIDIIAYTLMMHAAGSVSSGLGMLLLISIAGTALLLPDRGASAIAAAATLAILFEQTYVFFENANAVNYTHAGMLGAGFFVTALLTHILGRRLRESEQLAAQRGIDLANLARLNEQVVQLLDAGIVVVDHQLRTRLINATAGQMLGKPANVALLPLHELCPSLESALSHWRNNPALTPPEIHPEHNQRSLHARFIAFGQGENSGYLAHLEDSATLTQRAQQLKLASLGRLTASIAHEIRNPLGAISHASQLLSESPSLDKADTRLLEIIRNHSLRMNTIIENILQLSRREQFKPQTIDINDWTSQFAAEFCEANAIAHGALTTDTHDTHPAVLFDSTQLHQIVWNLCQNGWRYSRDIPDSPKLELHIGHDPAHQDTWLDIIDHGPGIAAESVPHIFEPFYTTDSTGTGLGLYIARELCECNRARLEYIAPPGGGSCFRITFGHYTDNNTQT